MKKALKIIIILFAALILIFAGGFLYIISGLRAGSKVEIAAVDPSTLSDGTYEGIYNAGRWSNKLSITVKSGEITEISVVEDVVFVIEEVSDELFNRVISAQNTSVDVVAGATVTSKAYLQSIVNALTD